MINWNERLEREKPFFRKVFQEAGAKKVLDTACGTGQHAIMFSSWGLSVSAADVSSEMVNCARDNSLAAGFHVDFAVAGLEEVDNFFSPGFDVITCVGNSLPHIRSYQGLERVSRAVSNLLRDGGTFILQIRNYNRVYEKNEKFMPLKSYVQEGHEYIYIRTAEMDKEFITFNIIVLEKNHLGEGSYRLYTEKLKPWKLEDITGALKQAGLTVTGVYGDMKFGSYDQLKSTDLVLTAQKTAILAGGS